MKPVPKNTDVDLLVNLAQVAANHYGRQQEADRVRALRAPLKAVLTAYRKTLKPRRRT